MKLVIAKAPEVETVTAAHARLDRYYGVSLPNCSKRAFITREKFGDGAFVIRCLNDLTAGNVWNQTAISDLTETILFTLARGWIVHEFDSAEELMQWVLQGK